mmetsp:Transcript_9446/g.14549  ORF Transcript_9446/g.14549 Transcript_9446/m.14549 type:complete len:169 (+) Transcript_9446:749-1255(+)
MPLHGHHNVVSVVCQKHTLGTRHTSHSSLGGLKVTAQRLVVPTKEAILTMGVPLQEKTIMVVIHLRTGNNSLQGGPDMLLRHCGKCSMSRAGRIAHSIDRKRLRSLQQGIEREQQQKRNNKTRKKDQDRVVMTLTKTDSTAAVTTRSAGNAWCQRHWKTTTGAQLYSK